MTKQCKVKMKLNLAFSKELTRINGVHFIPSQKRRGCFGRWILESCSSDLAQSRKWFFFVQKSVPVFTAYHSANGKTWSEFSGSVTNASNHWDRLLAFLLAELDCNVSRMIIVMSSKYVYLSITITSNTSIVFPTGQETLYSRPRFDCLCSLSSLCLCM